MVDVVFVFGSNTAGRHGAGAAKHAKRYCGAVYGVGQGRTGNSYAIPTKDSQIRTLPLDVIEAHVKVFLEYAATNRDLTFQVTPIGTGLAGYRHDQIAPMFKGFTSNCRMPREWEPFLG